MKEVLTLKELCALLGISRIKAMQMAKARELPAFRIGSGIRFNRESIDKWRFEQEGKQNAASRILTPKINTLR